jgi:hypothetical protein
MASLMPIAAVQLLAIVVRFAVTRESIVQYEHHHELPWYDLSGVKELLETLEITIPLILFFLVLIKLGYKSDIPAVCFDSLLESFFLLFLFFLLSLHSLIYYFLFFLFSRDSWDCNTYSTSRRSISNA